MVVDTVEKLHELFPVFKDQEIDIVNFEGHEYSLSELWLRYSRSKIGQHQAHQEPRFHKVFPLAQGDHTAHIELLGHDAHPTIHMVHTTANIVVPAIKAQAENPFYQQFTDEEKVLLLIASQIHDIDESEHEEIVQNMGFIVGDKPEFAITEEDERSKALIRTRYLYPKFYGDFSDELIANIERIITHQSGKFDAEAFGWLEKYGYLLTAKRAAELAIGMFTSEKQSDSETAVKLRNLAVSVFDRQDENLTKGEAELELIRRNADSIRRAIGEVTLLIS